MDKSKVYNMKYLIRSVKYFFYYLIIFCVFIAALVFLKIVQDDINLIFRNGYQSLYQILIMFAVVSAVYPIFGFMKKDITVPGETSEIKPTIIEFMKEKGYLLENETGEDMTFRCRSFGSKLSKMFEDRITLKRNISGYEMEGLRRDVVRYAYGIEYKFRNKVEE